MAKKELTAKQAEFVRRYLVSLNGAEAARKAGYGGKNHEKLAWKLTQTPEIREAIQKGMDARAKRVEVSADTILRELLKLAVSDVRKLFDETGKMLPPSQWPDEVAAAVSSVETEELFEGFGADRTWIGYTKKVKFWDKVKSNELLGKHLKLFTDRVEHEAGESLASLLAKSWKEESDGKKE